MHRYLPGDSNTSEPFSNWCDPAVACVTLFLALCIGLLGLILLKNDGHFVYSLDDPYIHLALSERISRGSYGLNAGEFVTPSSSIIWPFLLVPGAGTGIHPYIPLIYNLIFGTLAAWLIGTMVRAFLWVRIGRFRLLRCWLLSLLLVVAASLPALVFTGMEHVLQVLTAVVCAYGILLAYRNSPIPIWCIVVVTIAPAVRYESYVLCIALAFALYGQGRKTTALATLTISLLPAALFAVFLHLHGFPPLPNSILVKGAAFSSHRGVISNLLSTMRQNASEYLINPHRYPTTIILPFLVGAVWIERKKNPWSGILRGVTLAVILQMLAGSYGWFHRYEVFCQILAILVLLNATSRISHRWILWPISVILAFCDVPYFLAIYKTPGGSANIYCQQYQMRRFAHEYGGNFAVNDVGWVSYQLRPSVYVLDLFGLASRESMQQVDKSPQWLDETTRRHHCGLVMIYTSLFPGIPKDWQLVGRLNLKMKSISVLGSEVDFYETPFGDPRNQIDFQDKLHTFAAGLPKEAQFTSYLAPRESQRHEEIPAK
jgi:hypothetical protein